MATVERRGPARLRGAGAAGLPLSPRTDRRVLALVPNPRDAEMTHRVLAVTGLDTRRCADLDEVCRELDNGAAAVLLPEEALADAAGREHLLGWLAEQPPWSDLPLLVISRHGADSLAVQQAMERLGNVTILERPLRVASLVSAAQAARRARDRQYQLRDHLAEREQADRRKDEFLAMLAHELRNPLAPISNALHLLRRLNGADDASVPLLDLMGRQVSHLVRLIDDLLDVSRITRGKIQLRWSTLDLAAVLAQAIDTARPAIEAGGHRLHVELPEPTPVLEGDPVRLAQVVANLLNNAAKYSDRPGDIWLTALVEGPALELSVRDRGMGLSASMLEQVFEPFRQMRHTAERANGGLGIGLTLVRRLVELHGGQVSASSAGLGLGSTFSLRLPLHRRAPRREATPSPTAAPDTDAAAGGGDDESSAASASRRLLVVDDNRDAADSLAAVLSLSGFDARAEYDANAALASLRSFHPDVIVLDLGMPTMDGCDISKTIRQMDGYADVHLIALTGWGQEADRARTRQAGFDHHLLKPAGIEQLRAAIDEGRRH